MRKMPNLNPLRFFLAFVVLICHTAPLCKHQGLPYFDALPIFKRAGSAVTMFFMLSGYLIIRIVYRNKMAGTFSVKNFYLRRALRILPLYYLIVAFGFTFYSFILPKLGIPFEINYSLKTGILMNLFFIPNIFVFTYDPGAIVGILWSLGIEEQFYLFIAVIFAFINKNRIFPALLGIFIIYFTLYHLEMFSFLVKYHFGYFYLLGGGLFAILDEKGKLDFLKKFPVLNVVIVACAALFFTTDIFIFQNFVIYSLFECLLFGSFIFVISCGNFGFEIKSRLFNYLGEISFGIYMYHVIALNAVVFIFLKIKNYNVLSDVAMILSINVLTLLSAVLVAHLSYKYFETPFLRLKSRFREQ